MKIALAIKISFVRASIFAVLLPLPAYSQDASTQSSALPSAQQSLTTSRLVQGEGQTLPQGVMRFRSVYRRAEAKTAYGATGKSETSGLSFSAQASALVFEYGLTPAVSLQFIAPHVFENNLSMNGSEFQKSSIYREKYDSFIEVAAQRLVADKLCSDVQTCVIAINQNSLSLPLNTTLTLPTGEKLDVRAGVPLKTVASALVVNAAVPTSGRTGWGDYEIGALVALADPEVGFVKNWDLNVSLGLGLRLPTGSFTNVPAAQRPTGRGTLDLGIRSNIDKIVSRVFVVSWQNQMELMLQSGSKKRSSLLSSNALNSANPNISGADGQPNLGTFKRNEARQIGFFKMALSGGFWDEKFSALILNGQFKYDFDTPGEVSGVALGQDTTFYSSQLGATFDGLKYSVPLQLDVDYEFPIAGKNKAIAAQVMSATLKAFYKF